MNPVPDRTDALDRLETFEQRPDFHARLRRFERDCSLSLLPRLPAEVARWIEVADAFDDGQIGIEALTEARVSAWRFHDDRRSAASPAELSGLRAVMFRLWPPDDDDVYTEAAHFLEFVEEAGLETAQWWPWLLQRFGDA